MQVSVVPAVCCDFNSFSKSGISQLCCLQRVLALWVADSPRRVTGSILCTPDVAVSTVKASACLLEVTKIHCHCPSSFDFGRVFSLAELAGSGIWFFTQGAVVPLFLPLLHFHIYLLEISFGNSELDHRSFCKILLHQQLGFLGISVTMWHPLSPFSTQTHFLSSSGTGTVLLFRVGTCSDRRNSDAHSLPFLSWKRQINKGFWCQQPSNQGWLKEKECNFLVCLSLTSFQQCDSMCCFNLSLSVLIFHVFFCGTTKKRGASRRAKHF